MRQQFLSFSGEVLKSKCKGCGIELGNYGLWKEKDGPYCHICFLVPPIRRNENESD